MLRIIQNLFTGHMRMRKHFNKSVLRHLSQRIKECEDLNGSQIILAIEARLGFFDIVNKVTSKARASQLFSRLKVWDTENNSGVLIYLLLSESKIEIVADRTVTRIENISEIFNKIIKNACLDFKKDEYYSGIDKTLLELAQILRKNLPISQTNRINELPNNPIIL